MEYQVIDAGTAASLRYKVELLLKDGWRLQGGVSVSETDDSYTFCQAVVRKTAGKAPPAPSPQPQPTNP